MIFVNFNNMKNRITLLLITLFSLNFYHGQDSKTYLGNFQVQKHLSENINSETPLGFFVKGDVNKIKNICTEFNGQYKGSVKGWHYVKIPTNQYKAFNENKSIKQSYNRL